MRISDWSSDVCSSDLLGGDGKARAVDQGAQLACLQREGLRQVVSGGQREVLARQRRQREGGASGLQLQAGILAAGLDLDLRTFRQLAHDVIEGKIGRASCRERVGQYV